MRILMARTFPVVTDLGGICAAADLDRTVRYRAQVARFRDLLTQGGEGKAKMQASEAPRAVAAAMSTASALDLTVDDAIVLHDFAHWNVRADRLAIQGVRRPLSESR